MFWYWICDEDLHIVQCTLCTVLVLKYYRLTAYVSSYVIYIHMCVVKISYTVESILDNSKCSTLLAINLAVVPLCIIHHWFLLRIVNEHGQVTLCWEHLLTLSRSAHQQDAGQLTRVQSSIDSKGGGSRSRKIPEIISMWLSVCVSAAAPQILLCRWMLGLHPLGCIIFPSL